MKLADDDPPTVEGRLSGWTLPLLTFAALWGISIISLLACAAYRPAITGALIMAGALVFGALTLWIAPKSYPPPRMKTLGALASFLISGTIIGFSFFDGLAMHGGAASPIPLWPAMRLQLLSAGSTWFGNGFLLANPVLYFALPFCAVRLLGVRSAETGLRWGKNSVPVTIVWCLGIAAAIGLAMTAGTRSSAEVARTLVSNGLQNGFSEEFLFRGAFQFSIASLLNGPAAVVIGALVFGAWHLGLASSTVGGDLALATASAIAIQGTLGLILALLAERTGSLLAPSIAHVFFNSAG